MPKNVVICLDGTNNKLRAAANTNVVRLFQMLDLSDPRRQVAYYDPGVGTFSSPAAWTPFARTLSRWGGSLFGVGLRQNLAEAYCYLMSVYEPGDRIYVVGFSRGAYTARALTAMLELFGIFRRGSENLVPYAIAEYTKRGRHKTDAEWALLREYATVFGGDLGIGRKDHAPVHFVGVWDTVKAAGSIWRELKWPFTRQLPHAATIRHAVSIDEKRRKYREYVVHEPKAEHPHTTEQDLLEVWFAGVHSDVGGMFEHGARLSDIPLKWMAEHAVGAGLLVRNDAYDAASRVDDSMATGAPHVMGWGWFFLGGYRRRRIPDGANVHASVALRAQADPAYRAKLPAAYTVVDEDWRSPKPLPT